MNNFKLLSQNAYNTIKNENKLLLIMFVSFFIYKNMTFNYLFLITYVLLLILAIIKLLLIIFLKLILPSIQFNLYFNDVLDSRIIHYILLMSFLKNKINLYNIYLYIIFYFVLILFVNLFQAPIRLIIFYVQLYKIVANYILLTHLLTVFPLVIFFFFFFFFQFKLYILPVHYFIIQTFAKIVTLIFSGKIK